mmetsp:Transcript_151223/g.466421  ORF Transcript_151223/g.466421 Transcript_151223/m.466421 type:complete len:263 (+) Transcript_151223:59-847(+)
MIRWPSSRAVRPTPVGRHRLVKAPPTSPGIPGWQGSLTSVDAAAAVLGRELLRRDELQQLRQPLLPARVQLDPLAGLLRKEVLHDPPESIYHLRRVDDQQLPQPIGIVLRVDLRHPLRPRVGVPGQQVAGGQALGVHDGHHAGDVAAELLRLPPAQPRGVLAAVHVQPQELVHRRVLQKLPQAELAVVRKHQGPARAVETLVPGRRVLLQQLRVAAGHLLRLAVGEACGVFPRSPGKVRLERLGRIGWLQLRGPEKAEHAAL